VPQTPPTAETTTARTGAVCFNGQVSTAIGSGACSSNGGVCYWTLSGAIERVRTNCPQPSSPLTIAAPAPATVIQPAAAPAPATVIQPAAAPAPATVIQPAAAPVAATTQSTPAPTHSCQTSDCGFGTLGALPSQMTGDATTHVAVGATTKMTQPSLAVTGVEHVLPVGVALILLGLGLMVLTESRLRRE